MKYEVLYHSVLSYTEKFDVMHEFGCEKNHPICIVDYDTGEIMLSRGENGFWQIS